MTRPAHDLLTIDLTSGTASRSPLNSGLLNFWIGGRGLAVRLLRDHIPFSPDYREAPLVLTTGPMAGSGIPGTDRLILGGYSPLTGTIFTESLPGSMAPALASQRLIGVLITGTSPSPSIVRIEKDNVIFSEAGKLSSALTSTIVRDLPSAGSTLTIGPAACSGSLIAGIRIDHDASISRGGLGTSLAAKGLIALQIDHGEERFPCDGGCDDLLRLFRASPFLMGPFGIHRYGTLNLVDLIAERRMLPADNFRTTWRKDFSRFDGPAFLGDPAVSHRSCNGCPVGCHPVSSGEELPSFESAAAIAALLPDPSTRDIQHLDRLCREFGLDPISAAGAIGCTAEIEGRNFSFDTIATLFEQMAFRTGSGGSLADGVTRYVQFEKKPHLAMAVKGLELPPYDPRGAHGMALGYATSTKGGCVSQSRALTHEILRKPVPTDRFNLAGKARLTVLTENLTAAADTLGVCPHLLTAASLEEYAPLLSNQSGLNRTPADLAELGETIIAAERFCNHLLGFRPTDDMLPHRFFSEAGSGCQEFPVPPIKMTEFAQALEDYAAIRRLDNEGVPLAAERLQDLP